MASCRSNVKEGTLETKSRFLGIWKKRWTVLAPNGSDSAHTLSTYKEEKIYRSPTEVIRVDVKTNIVGIGSVKGAEHKAFAIQNTNGRSSERFLFRAHDRDERDEWLECIRHIQDGHDCKERDEEHTAILNGGDGLHRMGGAATEIIEDADPGTTNEKTAIIDRIGSDYPLPPKQRISTLSETHRKSSTFDDAKEGSDDDAEPVHSPPTPPTPPEPKASKKPNAAKFANLENMLKMRRLPMAPRPLQTEAPESKEVDSPRDPDTEKLGKFRKRLKIGVPRNGVLRMMRDDQMPEHLIRKLFPEEFQAEQPKKMTLRLERILTLNLGDTIWDEMDMISPRIGVERHSQRNLLESKFLRKQALKRSKKETVSSPKTMGLGAQRVKDIEIFLGQLGQRQLDLGSLCEAMLKMDATKLSLDAVQILAKVVPTEHEEAMLRKHRNQSNLNKAERFLVAVGAVDTKLAQRMELWAFAMEFDALCGDAELSLRILRSGHDAIKQSKSLKLMFKLILNVGNHLNSGSSPKRESGFKLSSLGQLKQCRDVENPKENLMEHLAASSDPEHREALQFTAELRPLGEASAVDVANLRAKCDDISSQLKVLGERLNGAVSRRSEDRFESVMRPFYGAASERVTALIAQKKAVFGDMERLAIWLHEPKNDKFPFLKTLSKFRLDFEHSIQSVEQRKQQMDSHRQ